MIKVHSYCSYKHSPLGFVYGSFEVKGKDVDNADYYLSGDNNVIVQTAFENGIIRRLCGKIPNSSDYIFLVRKLKHNYGNNHPDIGREVQMNFGFEFDSFEEFQSFTSGFLCVEKQDAQSLYEQLADCIIPDETVETYKYKILKNRFNTWIDTIKKQLSDNDSELFKRYKKQICITTSSTVTDYTEEICNLFNFPNSINNNPVDFCRDKNTANYFYPIKKKFQFSKNPQQYLSPQKKKKHPIMALMITIIFIVIFFFYGMHSSNSSKKKPIQSGINTTGTIMMIDNNILMIDLDRLIIF